MTQISAVRRIQFCAGHRVHNHESKCANWHGHNYVAFFHARVNELDSIGRVIDFSSLKEKIGGWVDKNWDHGFLYFIHDKVSSSVFSNELNSMKKFECLFNPTAENMADHLLNIVCPKVLEGTNVQIFKVVLWETENCFVEAKL